jgi:hypothetical protein
LGVLTQRQPPPAARHPDSSGALSFTRALTVAAVNIRAATGAADSFAFRDGPLRARQPPCLTAGDRGSLNDRRFGPCSLAYVAR